MGLKKLKDKSEDNVNTRGLIDLLTNSVTDLNIPFETFNESVSQLEFERRDGFIPFGHNRGGIDFITYVDILSLYGSGYHIGTKIENFVYDQVTEAFSEAVKQNPDLNENNEKDREKLYEISDESLMDEYSLLAWRIRIMYEGNGLVMIYSGWDKDAPYFRWQGKTDLEQKIKFKDKRDLKAKLKKAIQKAIKNI